MDILLLLLVIVLLFDIAALRWGADSRDGLHSPEWQRRSAWFLPVDHARTAASRGYLYLYRRSSTS